MVEYHLRRAEKSIVDENAMWAILARQKYLTLAMCEDSQPYLATLNYAYDRKARCIYFHCASEGRKISYLHANPAVWGQVLEDHGYVDGACDHAFRTVEFEGRVDFVEDRAEKLHALGLLIDRLESDPAAARARLLTEDRLSGVTIGRIHIYGMTGKHNRVPSEEDATR
jgi:hypothetical protein